MKPKTIKIDITLTIFILPIALLLSSCSNGGHSQGPEGGMTPDVGIVDQLPKGEEIPLDATYSELYSEQWGAKANDDIDDTDAIQATIDYIASHTDIASTLQFRPGKYIVSKPLMIKRGCIIRGAGGGNRGTPQHGTILIMTSDNTLFEIDDHKELNTNQNQWVNIEDIRLEGGSDIHFTSGHSAIKATQWNQIMVRIRNVTIGGFYHALETVARIYAENLFVNNTVGHGIVFHDGDWASYENVTVVASGGDAFHLTGLYAKLTDCETYGSAGWGVYSSDVDIKGGYFNGDYEGEVFIHQTARSARAANIINPVVKWAGALPDGWHGLTKNPHAIGIKIDTADNVGTVNMSNVTVFGSEGYGIHIARGHINISSSDISASGRSLEDTYEIYQEGGILTLGNSKIGGGGSGICSKNAYAHLMNNQIFTNGLTAIRVEKTQASILGNLIYSHKDDPNIIGLSLDTVSHEQSAYMSNIFDGQYRWKGTRVIVDGQKSAETHSLYE